MLPWQALPPELWTHIFTFLKCKDKLNASATCRHLRDVSQQPEMWTKRYFTITGQNEELSNISQFIHKFGCNLKHLTIFIDTVSFLTSTFVNGETVFSELEVICTNVKHLRSFHCYNWYKFYFIVSFRFHQAAILTALCQMLERQDRLTEFEFTEAYLGREEGCQVLNTLATRSVAFKLTSLKLRNFFAENITNRSALFLEILTKLKSLRSVGLTYQYMSQDVLTTLTSSCPGLKRICLFVESMEDYKNSHLPPPDWQKAAKGYPDLRVGLVVKVAFLPFPYHNFLFPHIPLTSLGLYNCQQVDQTDAMVEEQIAETTGLVNLRSLNTFILQRQKSVKTAWNRPEALVALVKACPDLTHLCLRMEVTFDALLQVAAAASPQGREERGSPAPHLLRITIRSCDTVLRKGALKKLEAVNPLCRVHISDDCHHVLIDGIVG